MTVRQATLTKLSKILAHQADTPILTRATYLGYSIRHLLACIVDIPGAILTTAASLAFTPSEKKFKASRISAHAHLCSLKNILSGSVGLFNMSIHHGSDPTKNKSKRDGLVHHFTSRALKKWTIAWAKKDSTYSFNKKFTARVLHVIAGLGSILSRAADLALCPITGLLCLGVLGQYKAFNSAFENTLKFTGIFADLHEAWHGFFRPSEDLGALAKAKATADELKKPL